MRIGIFDTGLGGEIVAKRLKHYFPDATFTVINDRKNLPYGNKTTDEIYVLTKTAVTPLVGKNDVIVLACNTATAAAIDRLRADFPDQEFVGYEPMVKPAAEITRSGCVVILATPATIKSDRYQNLVTKYGQNIRIFTPDCTTWASDIESGNAAKIELGVIAHCVDVKTDVIVLACTHYLELQDRIQQQFPDITVIEPTEAVASRITALTSQPLR